MVQYCPRTDCRRAGDTIGTCVDVQTIGCPAPKEVNPKTQIVLTCKRVGCHDKMVAVEIHDIMTGKATRAICAGDVATCQAIQVRVAQAQQK